MRYLGGCLSLVAGNGSDWPLKIENSVTTRPPRRARKRSRVAGATHLIFDAWSLGLLYVLVGLYWHPATKPAGGDEQQTQSLTYIHKKW
jgi:hypothetical protein